MRLVSMFFAFLFLALVPASAQDLRFRSVTVDVSPIAARGYPTFARKVEYALVPVAAEAFGGLVDPADPRGLSLVIRIVTVELPVVTGAGGDGTLDTMRSEGLVIDPKGHIVARASILSPVTAWITVASLPLELEEQRRIRALGMHGVYWLRTRLTGL